MSLALLACGGSKDHHDLEPGQQVESSRMTADLLSFEALVVAVGAKVLPQAWCSKCCWSASVSRGLVMLLQLSALFVSKQPCLPFDPQQSLKIQLCRVQF